MARGKMLWERARDVMRLKHYSLRTGHTYSQWIRRYVQFHNMKSPEDLADGER